MWANDIYDDGDYKLPLLPKYQKTDHLLVRNPLGTVKPTTYDLPGKQFTYGHVNEYNAGVQEALGSWKTHQSPPEAAPGRDFVKTNKYAAVSGCVTSKHNATFRRQNDFRLSQGTFQVRSSTVPDPSMVYGRANPRPASIDAILNNSFQRQWITEQRAIEQAQSARSARRSFRPSQHTRASLGHHKLYAPPAEPLFKMARFKNVPSRVAGPYRGLSMTRSLDRSLLAVERAENDMLAHTATGVVEETAAPVEETSAPETMQQGEAVPQ